MRCLLALVCLLPSQAAAGPFDGIWSPDPARCAVEYDPERVTIRDQQLWAYEELCSLGPPTSALSPAGAMIHEADCQGLDYRWRGRIVLIPTGDQGRMVMQSEVVKGESMQSGVSTVQLHRCN